MFEYRFLGGEGGDARFRLTIAVPVAEAVVPLAPMESVTLGEFRYVEVITNSFREAWPRVRDAAEAAGYVLTGLEREVYHAWHGEGNPETRVALQVGVR